MTDFIHTDLDYRRLSDVKTIKIAKPGGASRAKK